MIQPLRSAISQEGQTTMNVPSGQRRRQIFLAAAVLLLLAAGILGLLIANHPRLAAAAGVVIPLVVGGLRALVSLYRGGPRPPATT